ncbi:MAG: efflux RND transporter periplasmic adaptor subunit [Candidatus Binatia bacterium]
MNNYRIHLIWIFILFLAAGVTFGYGRLYLSNNSPTRRYETVQVDSGRIQQIFVDFNAPVQKGQLIAKIDPQLFGAAVEQARANTVAAQGNLTKAQAQAVDAERQYRRARALAERQLIALADVDTAETNAQAAQAQIEAAKGGVAQAQAALHQAQVNLAYTNIVSPTNGVVISRNVDVGQTVAASLQAPTLFLIAEDLAKMQVDTSVAEADVGKLQAGMSAIFTVDAYPNEPFTGKVRQIRNAPQNVQNVVTYDAVVDVENAELKLKPGMTANVTFIYAEKDQTLRIPNAALRFRPSPEFLTQMSQGVAGKARESASLDRRTVWVLRDKKPEVILLKTGISDGTFTEMVEGDVHLGDLLITDVLGTMNAGSGFAPTGQRGFRRIF